MMDTTEKIFLGIGLAGLVISVWQALMQADDYVTTPQAERRQVVAMKVAQGVPPTPEEVAAVNADFSDLADRVAATGGYRPTIRMTNDGKIVGGF